jgi:hypothetical protein
MRTFELDLVLLEERFDLSPLLLSLDFSLLFDRDRDFALSAGLSHRKKE